LVIVLSRRAVVLVKRILVGVPDTSLFINESTVTFGIYLETIAVSIHERQHRVRRNLVIKKLDKERVLHKLVDIIAFNQSLEQWANKSLDEVTCI
jgi:hypothetical protein